MQSVIATGCSYSDWEKVLPILQAAGLEPAGDGFAQWHADLFQGLDSKDFQQAGRLIHTPPDGDARLDGLALEAAAAPGLLADSRTVWLLDFWAEKLPKACFLLFYTRADAALSRAVYTDATLPQLLQNWQAGNRQLLQFQRRHRKRVLLLDTEAALSHPHEFIAVCRQTGLPVQSLPDTFAAESSHQPLERFLANLAVADHAAVQRLQAELEACAHPLFDMPPCALKTADLFDTYRRHLLQARGLKTALDESANRLEAVKWERNEAHIRNQQLQAQAAQATKQRADQQTRFEAALKDYHKLQADHKEINKENELLLLQLHQVQEELETTFLQKQELEQVTPQQDKVLQLQARIETLTGALSEKTAAAAESQAQLKQAQKEQDQQKQQLHSRMEQLTAARDRLTKERTERDARIEKLQRDAETLDAAANAAKKENELLLLQLHQVQEELETIFLQKQNLTQACKELEQDRQQLTQAKESLAQELRQLKDTLLAKDKAIEKQRRRAADLKKTVSWKISAPIRTVAKPFKRSNPKKSNSASQLELLKRSGLFDERWYLSQYADVAKEGADPVEHYLCHGAAEGRNPSPNFNTRAYLELNPDVAAAGMNPLVHFVTHGRSEGRKVYHETLNLKSDFYANPITS